MIEERDGGGESLALPSSPDLRSLLLKPFLGRLSAECDVLPWAPDLSLDDVFVDRVTLEVPRDGEAVRAAVHGQTSLARHLGLEDAFDEESPASEVPSGPGSNSPSAESDQPRIILRGEAGTGKTTILRQLAKRLADARLATGSDRPIDEGDRVALLVRLPDLKNVGTRPFEDLVQYVTKKVDHYTGELLGAQDPRGELVLLLDGYDEVSKAERPNVGALLASIPRELPRTPVALGTRPSRYLERSAQFKAWSLASVEPLGADRQKELLVKLVGQHRKFGGPAKPTMDAAALEDWVDRIQVDARYDEERGNPLWLTMAAIVIFEEDREPGSRVDLLDAILRRLEAGKHRRDQRQIHEVADDDSVQPEALPRSVRPVLRWLAHRMSSEGLVQVPRSVMETWLEDLKDSERGADGSAPTPWTDLRRDLLDLKERCAPNDVLRWLERNSILTPPERRIRRRGNDIDEDWRFWHRSTLEFLTSEWLWERWTAAGGQDDVLARARSAAGAVRRALLQRFDRALSQIDADDVRLADNARSILSALRLSTNEGWLSSQGPAGLRSWCDWLELVGAEQGSMDGDAESDNGEDDVARFWSEPLGMLAERLVEGEVEVLLESLEDAPAISRRALMASRAVSTNAVMIVLSSLEEEEDRGAVISQVEHLIEDRMETLDLLRSLGLAPRIRADLYFVDEALLAFGVRHEDLADEADAARLRIYEELPVEPTWRAPFERTFGDPGVPLWRPVTRHLTFGYGDRELEQVTEQPFQISAVPVTEEMYRVFDPHDDQRKSEPGLLPARSVSWWCAMAYCRWAGAKLGFGLAGSLPTERQWECAARAGTEGDYWFSPEALDEHGWYEQNSESRAHDVATRPPNGDRPQQPNPNGLLDVHGNVWEWCLDLFDRDGPWRVLRGGSYWDTAAGCRSGYRSRSHPAGRNRNLGFRLVLPAELR
ncbi:SUMF1/EgtB/PvdO family nonheme iron enzyme [Engelhardtia mirabilis]|uniref:SUMF1/EgtB/PvdO family nonheme iron enzyme n=1 Tax=Engelhardtia mirabilis TaxID=2528011 RepID=UPI003AF35495